MPGLLTLGWFVGAGWLAGCEASPLGEEYARTPFERYQVLRGQAAPLETPNEFGVPEKALRERLSPLGSR